MREWVENSRCHYFNQEISMVSPEFHGIIHHVEAKPRLFTDVGLSLMLWAVLDDAQRRYPEAV